MVPGPRQSRNVGAEDRPDKHDEEGEDGRRKPKKHTDPRIKSVAVPPQWFLDATLGSWYWYDASSDMFVYQNGRRVRRSAHVPRPSHPAAVSQATATSLKSSSSPRSGTQTSIQGSFVKSVTSGIAATSIQNQTPRFSEPGRIAVCSSKTVTASSGTKFAAQDRLTQVETTYQTGPAEEFTDPALLAIGISAKRLVLGNSGNDDSEHLFPSYRRRYQAKKFFTIGRVFSILWTEGNPPSGSRVSLFEEADTAVGRSKQKVFSSMRRFVVIREGETYCSALSIKTYNGAGVSDPGVKKSDHCIIHSTKSPPNPVPIESPGRDEAGMLPQAIRVDLDDEATKLDPLSRLNYGMVYTIQHNVKAKSLGKVNANSASTLINQFRGVWARTAAGGPSSTSTQPAVRGTVDFESQTQDSKRRDSHMSTLESSGGSSDSRRKQVSSQERANGTTAQKDVQARARAALQELVARGYSQQQALEVVRARFRQPADGQQMQGRTPGNEESGEDSESDDDSKEDDSDDDESV